MKILILNYGSSSIKCSLYEFKESFPPSNEPLLEASIEWKNKFDMPSLTIKKNEKTFLFELSAKKNKKEALLYLMPLLLQGKTAVLSSLNEIAIVGHRIVHGGSYFPNSAYITSDVKEKILALSKLAPLHNVSELEGIEILEQLLPNTPQLAVFDTSFHHTLPKEVQVYPGPYQWIEEDIRRYGFHGISFQYCAKQSAHLLHKDLNNLKIVICHLGSGASLCAIKNGVSLNTTMGFTPLEGLMMDTRSGSIDPGILLYLLENKKKSLQELSRELYEESGLLGISGISTDMRAIIKASASGDPRATLALDVYIHRLVSFIGSMIASLQGIHVLVFTAGIGENTPLLRERVCDSFAFLGLQLDHIKNTQSPPTDCELSTTDSKVKVLLIHTQEAFEIACECFNWKRKKITSS